MDAKEKRGKIFSRSISLATFFIFASLICFVSASTDSHTFGSIQPDSSIYTFTTQLASQGVTQSIGIGDSISFPLKKDQAFESYLLTLTQVSDNSADLTIQNTSLDITLNLGETKKLTLISDGFYDISVKLESVSNGQADITLQTIHELVPSIQPANPSTNETTSPKIDENTNSSKIFTKTNIAIVVIVLIILIFLRYTYALRRRIHSFQPSQHTSYRLVK